FNPREKLAVSGSALALVIDNGWASAPDWERRVATAERLIADARDRGVPVVLALTAEKANADIGPFDAEAALQRLNAVEPRPVPTDRPAIYERVATVLQDLPGASIAILADGLAAEGDERAFADLFRNEPSNIVWIEPERLSTIAVTNGQNEPNSFIVTAARSNDDPAPRQATVYASDDRGRRIAEAVLSFGPGETEAQAEMNVPFELRNDFTSVGIDGERHAGAVRVLDENSKRRRVGLVSQGEADQAQPLLSPL